MSLTGRRSVGRRVVLAGFVVAAVAAFAPAAQAADCSKFASASGSDTGAGTLASPLRSAQKLVDSLAAGQTGCLRGGSYSSVSFARSGSATAPITLRSYPGERARIYGSITVRSNWITLSELDIEGDGSMNTIKVYAADTVVQDNRITNKMRGRSCMMLGSSSAGSGAAHDRAPQPLPLTAARPPTATRTTRSTPRTCTTGASRTTCSSTRPARRCRFTPTCSAPSSPTT